MKKKMTVLLLLLSLLVITGCLLTSLNITIRERPPMIFVADEELDLVVIPGTYVYWIDTPNGDVYFYGGMWWHHWGKSWYRAEIYSGSWIAIKVMEVPHSVRYLPSNWKHRRNDAPHVRWAETKDHWKDWENNKHWEKRKWKHEKH